MQLNFKPMFFITKTYLCIYATDYVFYKIPSGIYYHCILKHLNIYAFHFTIKCQAEKRKQRGEYINTQYQY